MTQRIDTIWHYTPSNTPPAELEAILIEREPLLEELQEAVSLCVAGKGTRHFLLVGPRGAGKTHVISVLHHRLAADPELRPKIVLGWLPEDMFGMGQAVNWFRTLADELIRRGEMPELAEPMAGLKTPQQRTAESVSQLIVSLLGDRTLVILHENLNRVLRQLGKTGQQTIRAFLQNHPQIMLIATTPSISEAMVEHKAPFYGAFAVRNLEELTYEGTLELFKRLARQRGDKETEEYLETSVGKGRVRSVHALAGSNPRILVVFAAFMSRKGLERLLPLFEKTIDDLTPYYQERMESLTPQQQEVLLLFLRKGHALNPSEVAEELWLEQRTAAKVLGDLLDLGFLRRQQDGKRSWYDLREPLMKMSWQVKDARTEPLELIVDFVRVWFTPLEAREQSELAPSGSSVQRTLQRAAELGFKLDLEPMEGSDEIKVLLYRNWEALEPMQRVKSCERLVATKSRHACPDDFLLLAEAHYLAGDEGTTNELMSVYGPAAKTGRDFGRLAELLGLMGRYSDGLQAINAAIDLVPGNSSYWEGKSYFLASCFEFEGALEAANRAIELDSDVPEAWFRKSYALRKLQRNKEALEALNRALEINAKDAAAWTLKSVMLRSLNLYDQAVAASDRAIALDPSSVDAWASKAAALLETSRSKEAKEAISKWRELDPFFHNLRLFAAGRALKKGNFDQFRLLSERGLKEATQTETFRGGLVELANEILSSSAEADLKALIRHLIRNIQLQRLHEEMGKAVVQTIPNLLKPETSQERAERWLVAWQSATEGNDAYLIPLRILEAAVRYKAEPSQAHLLQLPAEERAILASLLPEEAPKLKGRRPPRRRG